MFMRGIPVYDSGAERENLNIASAGTAETSTGSYDAGALLEIRIVQDDNFFVGATKAKAESKTVVGNLNNPVLWQLSNDDTAVWVDVGTNGSDVVINQIRG